MITILLLIIIYLSFISLGLPDSLLGSAWPSMYGSLSVPISYAGMIAVIISVGTVVSSIISEKVIKRFGTGIVTCVSVFMTALALWGFSFSSNFIMLCVCAVPLGLGAGSVDTGLNNYVALHFKAKHMSWLHCFWGIGAALGPIVMSFFLHNKNSWRVGYNAVSIIQFVLVALLLLSLPLWKKSSAIAVNSENSGGISLKLPELIRMSGVKLAIMIFFFYCAIESTVGLWGSSYLVITKGVSSETAAKWISIYYLGITLGRFLCGFLTAKLNNRQMIWLGLGIIVCGITFLILPIGDISQLIGLHIIGLGCSPIFPSLLHETPVNFGIEHSQAIMGLQMAGAYLGTAIIPPLFGMMASRLGYHTLPLFLAIFLLIIGLSVRCLNKEVDIVNKKTQA